MDLFDIALKPVDRSITVDGFEKFERAQVVRDTVSPLPERDKGALDFGILNRLDPGRAVDVLELRDLRIR